MEKYRNIENVLFVVSGWQIPVSLPEIDRELPGHQMQPSCISGRSFVSSLS